MRKLCVWGTGKFAKYYSYMHSDLIFAYIDNDREKMGSCFCQKRVYHPSEIEEWSSYFIIVSSTYYDEVSAQLRMYGLKEDVDFKKEPFTNNGYSDSFILYQFEQYLGKIQKYCDSCGNDRKKIVFWGAHYETEEVLNYHFLEDIAANEKYDLLLISDTRQDLYEEYKRVIDGVSVALFGLPFIFAYKSFVINDEEDDTYETQKGKESDPYIEELIDQMNDDPAYKTINGKTRKKILFIIEYIERMISITNPSYILCMDSVQPVHRILRKVAYDRGIPSVFIHQGLIPGTIAFDPDGEVGESIPALFPKEFNGLPIEVKELDEAEKVLSFLLRSRANRKEQPTGVTFSDLINKIDRNKKTVFFAAQNDVRSYMVPYTEQTRRYYSPTFRSSIEAANYIATICKKYDWNIIYKPHPMYRKDHIEEELADNIVFIEKCDVNDLIDIADLTVTVLSSLSYNSLVRNTPVLMLGYGWLNGSGCTYEAFNRDDVEIIIKKAMNEGYLNEQRECFIRYTARCLKYYLFDDEKTRAIRFGKRMPRSIEEIYSLRTLIESRKKRLKSFR